MRLTIKISKEYEFKYDENSKEFKEAYDSYKDIIDSSATKRDMIKHIAYNVDRVNIWDVTEFLIEGVGNLSYNGKIPDNWCGIEVIDPDPECEYECD